MKKLRIDDIIRTVDDILIKIVVICFILGGIGTLIQLIRFGYLFEPCCGD